jgi:uncharacterized protein (DUF58 family)
MNNKIRLIGLLIFSLIIAALITRDGDLALMTLPFLGYLGIGVFRSLRIDRLDLSAIRTVQFSRSNGKVNMDVRVDIKNESPQTVHLTIKDDLQAETVITDGALQRRVSVRSGESTELCYTLSTTRGEFSWKSVRVAAGDPLGLIQTDLLLPAAASIQIRPAIRKFKAISLRPHSTLHSPGSIPAHLGGSGTDFYGIREYQPGDPLRSLDWRLTARHPFKFFTKEFEQEEIADIGLILDGRQNTEMRIGEESLFEQGVSTTASLAEMFLHQGHRVSLLVVGKRLTMAFPGYGKIQLNRVLGCLSKAHIESEERVTAHLDFLPIRMFPSHSMIVVISPLTADDLSFYQRLRAHGYQVVLISPDPIDFIQPVLEKDINTRLAIRSVKLERRLLLDRIARLRIPVIDWRVHQPLFPLVRNALTRSRGQGE